MKNLPCVFVYLCNWFFIILIDCDTRPLHFTPYTIKYKKLCYPFHCLKVNSCIMLICVIWDMNFMYNNFKDCESVVPVTEALGYLI